MYSLNTYYPPQAQNLAAGGPGGLVPTPLPPGETECPDGHWPDPVNGLCFPNPPYPGQPGVPCAPGYTLDESSGMCVPMSREKPLHWGWLLAIGLASAGAGVLLVKAVSR